MPALTRRVLLYGTDRPRGYMTLARFLDAYDRGDFGSGEIIAKVAAAFTSILEKNAQADVALQLKRQRGEKRPASLRTVEKRYGPIAQFIDKELAATGTTSGRKRWALTKAIREQAARKFHRSEREIEKAWKFQRPVLIAIATLFRQQDLVRAELSAEERKQWGHRSGVAIYRLARRRAKSPNKK